MTNILLESIDSFGHAHIVNDMGKRMIIVKTQKTIKIEIISYTYIHQATSVLGAMSMNNDVFSKRNQGVNLVFTANC